MMMPLEAFVHATADVSPRATIGHGTRIWHLAQVREEASIGTDCIVGKNVYIDVGVQVGDRCKVENNASLFAGTVLEDEVFIGPHACLTNDKVPRAAGPNGTLKTSADWSPAGINVGRGAAVGAGAIVIAGVTIGRHAMIGAGAVVTRDVGNYEVVVGNPARAMGFVCRCGATRSRTVVGTQGPKCATCNSG